MTFDPNTVVHQNDANWEHYPAANVNVWFVAALDHGLEAAAGFVLYFYSPGVWTVFGLPAWLASVLAEVGQALGLIILGVGLFYLSVSLYGIREHGKHHYVRCTHCHVIICKDDKQLVSQGDL